MRVGRRSVPTSVATQPGAPGGPPLCWPRGPRVLAGPLIIARCSPWPCTPYRPNRLVDALPSTLCCLVEASPSTYCLLLPYCIVDTLVVFPRSCILPCPASAVHPVLPSRRHSGRASVLLHSSMPAVHPVLPSLPSFLSSLRWLLSLLASISRFLLHRCPMVPSIVLVVPSCSCLLHALRLFRLHLVLPSLPLFSFVSSTDAWPRGPVARFRVCCPGPLF